MKEYVIKTTNITDDELKSVAQIHIKSINLGFLAQLGPTFLFYLYKSINECEQTELIIANNDKLTIGFISGCTSLKPAYKHLLKKYFIPTFISLVPKLFNFTTIKKIFEIITYSSKDTNTLDNLSSELLSLAVIESYRGSGIAECLYKQLQLQLQLSGFSEFKIIVGNELLQAQKFYEKMGATKVGIIELHGNSSSFIYKASTN